jgi:hypothetical protein
MRFRTPAWSVNAPKYIHAVEYVDHGKGGTVFFLPQQTILSVMINTESNEHGAKHSNAVNTEAPDSGKNITITKDLETWGWLTNGIGLLLTMSILGISDLNEDDAEDVQYAAHFCQELNQQLIEHYQ